MRILTGILFIFFLIGCGGPTADNGMPELETQLIDGSDFRLSEFKGNYVVLDFWGSWCGPCIREMPELVALHQKYGQQVVFVTIALERNDRNWKKVADRFGFSWKYQIVETAPMVVASEIARNFGVTEIPATFVITPEGKLLPKMDIRQVDEFLSSTSL